MKNMKTLRIVGTPAEFDPGTSRMRVRNVANCGKLLGSKPIG
jgi:hypothetical protein